LWVTDSSKGKGIMLETRLVGTKHGEMWVIEGDPWVSRSLVELGEWSEAELVVIKSVLDTLRPGTPEGLVVVEAGAYIGDLTIPMSRMVQKVYAFEPQPEIAEILARNLELNGVRNVEILPFALGHMDMGISFTPNAPGDSPGSTQMMPSGQGQVEGEMRTLDSFGIHPHFVKADVEGMETLLLQGGQETFKKDGPVFFYECDTVITPGETTEKMLQKIGYFLYQKYAFPIWQPGNFRGAGNTFGYTGSLMGLGVPLFGKNGRALVETIQNQLEGARE
jgi:FkbM family methyltransferase